MSALIAAAFSTQDLDFALDKPARVGAKLGVIKA